MHIVIFSFFLASLSADKVHDHFWGTIKQLCPSIPRIAQDENGQPKVQLERKRLVGFGSYGRVYPASYQLAGTRERVDSAVIKVMQVQSSTKAGMFAREACQMFKFRDSPHIAQIQAIGLESLDKESEIYKVYMAMPEYGPDLLKVTTEMYTHLPRSHFGKKLFQTWIRKILYQTALALQEVHSKHIMHLDIKPSNFLFNSQQSSRVVLTDFGTSIESKDSLMDRFSAWLYKRPGRVGTTKYVAPELMLSKKHYVKRVWHSGNDLLYTYFTSDDLRKSVIESMLAENGNEAYPTTASDIFSLGATFYKIASGIDAFPVPSVWIINGVPFRVQPGSVIASVFALERDHLPDCSPVESDLCRLIHAMLQLDPNKRPHIQEVLNDPYFSSLKRS